MGKAWVGAAASCFLLALGFLVSMRLYASGEVAPGDDTPFTLLMLIPAALLAGTLVGVVGLATGRAPRKPILAMLLVNGLLLLGFVVMAGVGIAGYSGR